VQSADNNARAAVAPDLEVYLSEAGEPALAAQGDAALAGGSEHELAALAARTRDPLAMRRFLETIAPSVRRVCRNVLGSAHVDFEDVVQDCLIEILRALPKYRAESPIVHYTNRIALRASIAARKRGRNREHRLRAFAEQTSAFTPDREGDSVINLRLVRKLIDDLPEVQIETLLLRTVLGYSVEEIAAAMQVPVNTAKSRLRVGKDFLRRRLEREEAAAGRGEQHGA
jgi:RNA polymerase sigma-70 factor, ECF subfamily